MVTDAGHDDLERDERFEVVAELCEVFALGGCMVTGEGAIDHGLLSVGLKSRDVPCATRMSGSPDGP